ncbi:MAG: hypothetical protein QM597_05015 [Aeromicrobium sp.]|uniref:hypothetical protein n=1 Tax=Aeromicrobium sp. TaxID=1871063 RepID=UPI0039E6F173
MGTATHRGGVQEVAMAHWRRIAATTVSVMVALGTAASCGIGSSGTGDTSDSATTPTEIAAHEGGPESPLAFGLTVPDGAVQLGPLARYRSDRLVQAYQPELTEALARQGVSDAVSAARSNDEGLLAETPPEITKSARPDDDTFALLEDPPPADITTALIRLDSDQTETVRDMVRQIAALLPDAGIDAGNFTSYCTVVEERVRGCHLQAEGVTDDDRQLLITMDVDPGDVTTRVAPPSSLSKPVMQVRVEDLSDPRLEQPVTTEGADPSASATTPSDSSTDNIIWPAMDTEAAQDTALLNGWVLPEDTTLLLSSFHPAFVSLWAKSSAEAREIARSYVESLAPDVAVRSDSYEGLNEVDVTFSATAPDGSQAMATHVITARGNYVMLFYTPAA